MDSEEDLLVAMLGITLFLSVIVLRRRTVIRKYWVNPYLRSRNQSGRFFTEFQDMMDFPQAFEENFHMARKTFELLFSKVEQYLHPKRNTRIDTISPKQRLAIALEYYACGTFQRHIPSVYRLSKASCGLIIQQVSTAIIKALKTEMIEMNPENWIRIANEYNYKWQLPNCLGAFDGKHVAIKKPPGSGSEYFNYKRYHSIILMALADANYRFISIDVGAKGSEGDANVFSRSELGRIIKSEDPQLHLPPDAFVGNAQLPYYFIGDDAFPLLKRLIKPYKPTRREPLTSEEVICNYRISRARRCVESAFGILVTKWACVGKTFHCKPENAKKIVAACCLLHNFMINQNYGPYIPQKYCDLIDEHGEYVQGIWRSHNPDRIVANLERTSSGRVYEDAKRCRDALKNFVNSAYGSVNWQVKATHQEPME